MAQTPETPAVSSDRLWAEQLAIGMALSLGVLIFMSFYHPEQLSSGTQVLSTGYLPAYGWASAVGVLVQLVVHEGGSLFVARRFGLPLRLRPFPFGVNAAATLSPQPRQVWRDAVVGLAGPVTGTLLSGLAAIIFACTDNPFFLGMACVGCFYNLFTLIPILELEGGWVAPAIAPQAWLFGLFLALLEMPQPQHFNLVLLGVISFGVPRLLHLLRARAPREDLACTGRQRLGLALVYMGLVLGLAWYGSTAFVALEHLVPAAMGD
jgi:Zn-dependent protease